MVGKNFLTQYDVVPIKENQAKLCKVKTILTEDVNAFTDSLFEQMIFLQEYLEFNMLEREHFYIVACNKEHRIKGVLLLKVGEYNQVEYDAKRMILFLLLIDAYEFYSIHNHPNNVLKGSEGDKLLNNIMLATGIALQIPYVGGFVINEKGYVNTSDDIVKSFYGKGD